jgi:hypothetical protein
MTVKSLACFALFCALVAQVADAKPTLAVHPIGPNGDGNREWLVTIAPDPTAFSDPIDNPDRGLGGALAAELAFSIDDPTDLLDVVIANPVDWDLSTIGTNPFTGGFTDGIYFSPINDNAFAAYGSAFLTTADPSHFLKITTAGTGSTTVRYGMAATGLGPGAGAIIAEASVQYEDYTGVVSVPEPATLAIFAIASALPVLRRKRTA